MNNKVVYCWVVICSVNNARCEVAAGDRLLLVIYGNFLVEATFIISFGDGSGVSSDTSPMQPTLALGGTLVGPCL